METGVKAPGSHIPGWMDEEELDWLYQTSKGMPRIAEIGSYLGRSTFALCSGCPGTVYAVDHFRGSAEHANEEPVRTGALYLRFWENMRGFTNMVLVRMDSTKAAVLFKDKYFDMVFIDGAHDYESVAADLRAWLPKASKLICGHDGNYDTVRKALIEVWPSTKINDIPNRIWSVKL